MTVSGVQLKQFPSASPTQDADLIYTSQGGTEKAMTAVQLAAYANAKVNPANLPSRNTLTGSETLAILQAGALVEATVNDLTTTNATRETFLAGTGFTPGVTTSITLAGTYGSIENIGVYFDTGAQFDCTLTGQVLGFNPVVPPGIKAINITGGSARTIGTPSAGTVGDPQIAPGSGPAILLNKMWTLKRFGCKVDGVTDDTTKAINAFASGELLIEAEQGSCVISGTIPVPFGLDGFCFKGPSRRGFQFLVQDAALPAISVASQMTGVELRDFTISRVPTATVGGDGISWTGSNSFAIISGVLVQNCYRGFALGSTDFSRIEGCIAQKNQNDGFQLVNTLSGGQLQWNSKTLLSQMNGRHGFSAISQAGGTGSISMGTLDGLNSYGNSGIGFGVFGVSGYPINGVRLVNGFFGGDGSHEVFLDSYGGGHIITNVFTELCGTATTGPTLTTPATNVGSGFYASANNLDASFENIRTNGASSNGFATSAGYTLLNAGRFTNNGIGGDANNAAGVNHFAGVINITGGNATDTGQGTQKYGLATFDGSKVTAVGFDLAANVTAPYFAAINSSAASLVACRGVNTNFNTPISENGTAFTNP
jgi:hypothetical protein